MRLSDISRYYLNRIVHRNPCFSSSSQLLSVPASPSYVMPFSCYHDTPPPNSASAPPLSGALPREALIQCRACTAYLCEPCDELKHRNVKRPGPCRRSRVSLAPRKREGGGGKPSCFLSCSWLPYSACKVRHGWQWPDHRPIPSPGGGGG